MPLHKTSRIIKPAHLALQRELVEEWQNPSNDRTAEPVIYEADPGSNEPIELYVVWSKWHGVSAANRSEVILDAFEAVRGRNQVRRVAIATGWTPEEARESGLETLKDDDVE